MATNKHAVIRYQALDRCFSNFARRFYIEDLIEACNDAIYDFTGKEDGIERRQLFDDIKFMESEAGGKSSVSCPLKPSDSAPLKHSTMPP